MILTAGTYTIDVPPMLNVGDKVYVNTLSFKDKPITKKRIKDYERSSYMHACICNACSYMSNAYIPYMFLRVCAAVELSIGLFVAESVHVAGVY